MNINKIHHADFMENEIPDNSAKLIIADPPYFEVKGAFDFVWPSFDRYLEDVKMWAAECERILDDNGTLFWWGHARKIAYSQVILDNHFNLLGSPVWKKTDAQTNKNDKDKLRTFSPVTERLLMYGSKNEDSKHNVNYFAGLRSYFKDFQKDTGLTKSEIIKRIGGRADHPFRWSSSQWELPTPETYSEILKLPSISGDFERRTYSDLKIEHDFFQGKFEARRRQFNLPYLINDVLEFSQQVNISKNFDHETIKPEKLTQLLIQVCSKPGDLVFIPFSGSGTECAVAAREGRNFIGFDIGEKNVKMSNDRVNLACRQKKLRL